jgi:fructose-specific component phosphotransferase system IIB-like protein
MRRSTLAVFASSMLWTITAAASPGSTTPATHYRWKDASGVVHFGDTIPASALSGGYDIVNNQGMVVRHVQRELTPAERKAAELEAARAAAAKRAAQQRSLEDAQMMSAYPTAKSLQDYQQSELNQIQNDIKTVETNLQSQEGTLTDLLAHAADLENSGKPVPVFMNKRISDQRQTVNDERKALDQRKADYVAAQVKFAAQLQHYRELRSKFQNEDDGGQP